MKISQLIKNLELIRKQVGDLECWYAKDDEGNGFGKIFYDPSVVFIDANKTYVDYIYEDDNIENCEQVVIIN